MKMKASFKCSRLVSRSLLFLVSVLMIWRAEAHSASDSFLVLKSHPGQIQGEWDLPLQDLELAVGLDIDANGEITWGEVKGRREALESYAWSRLQISVNGSSGKVRSTELMANEHNASGYAVLRFVIDIPQVEPLESLTVSYQTLFDLDAQHRGLLRVEHGDRVETIILAPDQAQAHFNFRDDHSQSSFWTFVKEGIWHIWIGFDHILFLLALLLPSVVHRETGRWVFAESLGIVLYRTLSVVTAFTLAHSLTLCLATLRIVELPSRWVESFIAASVVLAAVNNFRPWMKQDRGWQVAFAFGLIHGFGFANVLSELALPKDQFFSALLGFNLGVEAGQLVIVLAFLPIAYLSRRTWIYHTLVLRFGSLMVAALAGLWMVERVWDVTILGF